MTTTLAAARKALITSSMDEIKSLIKRAGVTRASLDHVKQVVMTMTKETEMFGHDEFPSPTPDEVAKVYLITDDQSGDFSLYLISAQPLGPSPVHDHGTFAVIAGLQGNEENTLYKRLDDQSDPAKAQVEEDYKVTLSKGDAIAFMPEDIHRIQVTSEIPTRHFHLYGKGFEQQTDRLEFNLADGTAKSVGGSMIPVDDSRRVL
ncbi:MAG: cysteine dioxygenase family protein [Pseudomonadales bacterium]|nr:cysteine dioxygenase family protein [Pseudomonadales bacterium]